MCGGEFSRAGAGREPAAGRGRNRARDVTADVDRRTIDAALAKLEVRRGATPAW